MKIENVLKMTMLGGERSHYCNLGAIAEGRRHLPDVWSTCHSLLDFNLPSLPADIKAGVLASQ
jgi:hypothetical protein